MNYQSAPVTDNATPTGVASDPCSFMANAMLTVLTGPNRWIQGAVARDRHGSLANPISTMAESWDITGSFILAQQRFKDIDCDYYRFMDRFNTLTGRSPIEFNDLPDMTYLKVCRVLKKIAQPVE